VAYFLKGLSEFDSLSRTALWLQSIGVPQKIGSAEIARPDI